jgi:hypothetical protein
VLLAGALFAGTASAESRTPGPLTISQHAPVHHKALYAVEFGKRKAGHGRISGQLPGAPPGTTVTLQANRFPFHTGFRAVAHHQTSTTGAFHFRVKPTLATKYRVTALTLTSRVVTFYVVSGYTYLSQQRCETAPTCTVGATLDQFYPAQLRHSEGDKRWFLYAKVNRNCCHTPAKPRLLARTNHATVQRQKVNATTEQVTFTIHLRVGTRFYYYRWGSCQRETEAQDGFNLPRHFGPCGGSSVPWRYFITNLAG